MLSTLQEALILLILVLLGVFTYHSEKQEVD